MNKFAAIFEEFCYMQHSTDLSEAGRGTVLQNTSTVASGSDTLFWVYLQRFQYIF